MSKQTYVLLSNQHVSHESHCAEGFWGEVELACSEVDLTALREHLVHVESRLDLGLDCTDWHFDDVVLLCVH